MLEAEKECLLRYRDYSEMHKDIWDKGDLKMVCWRWLCNGVWFIYLSICLFIYLFIYLRSDKFGSQLDRKIKTWFFNFLDVYLLWIERNKFWFYLQNSGILHTKMDQRRDPMKMNLDNFQIQQWLSQTVRAQKVDEKNGVICLVPFFPSWVMVLKLPKIV